MGTLLLAAGLGSAAAERFRLRPAVIFPAIALLTLGLAHGYPWLVGHLLPWPLWARGVATVALIAPLGFFLGMPGPTGIVLVGRDQADAVPWMWGCNGATTFLGSVVAVILAMGTGFTAVIDLAAAGYLVAFVALGRATRAAAHP